MKKHIMIGSLICVATVLIFLVFWGELPSDVPIHFDSNGNVNSVLPKTAVVFGTPAICAILNVLSGFALMKKNEERTFMYYLIPVISIIVAVVILVLAL
jgi:uncharacterized membrane protein